MIHGGAASIGCIAIGDQAIEELFWLVAAAGPTRCEVLLAPSASPPAPTAPDLPTWVQERYARLAERLAGLPWTQAPRP